MSVNLSDQTISDPGPIPAIQVLTNLDFNIILISFHTNWTALRKVFPMRCYNLEPDDQIKILAKVIE
jgi:hypothetical protein